MKLKYLVVPLIASCVTFTSFASHSTFQDVNIIPGVGYSDDTQQISSDVCYKMHTTSTTGQESIFYLNTAMSFLDLLQEFREDVINKIGIGFFSSSSQSSYFRSIQDTSYSLSLNYYQQLFNTVRMQPEGVEQDALTEQGKIFYKKQYPYFGILCGNNYVSSFKQGAQLIMSLELQFVSHAEKGRFESSSGVSFGNIIEASQRIQQIATAQKINGSIVIQAYQRGGDPSQLSKILAADRSGKYYALSCSLQDMEACVNTANGLLNYARNEFSAQISFESGKGLVPLGIGFATYEPISYTGLTPPPSFVTPQVEADRLDLADMLDENRYYQQGFNQLLQGLPLDRNSLLYKNSQALLPIVERNLEILQSPSNPESGALGCYSIPDKCHVIRQNIQSRLTQLQPTQLSYLDPIARMVHFTSGLPNSPDWYPVDDAGARFVAPNMQFGFLNGMMIISPFAIIGVTALWIDDNANNIRLGNLTGSNGQYSGQLCSSGGGCSVAIASIETNPFYFSIYVPQDKNSFKH